MTVLLQTIFCYTDGVNNNWLRYILDQFCYVQKARFHFEIRSIKESSTDSQFSIWYVTEPEGYFNEKRLIIPRRESYQTDDYSWHDLSQIIPEEKRFVGQKVSVFRETEHSCGTIPFDLFYNAFVHLSRLEEWEQEQAGELIHSYAFRHRRKNKVVYSIPVVNYLFLLLEHLITRHFGDGLFEPKGTFRLQLTHDVDYTEYSVKTKEPATIDVEKLNDIRRLNMCISLSF